MTSWSRLSALLRARALRSSISPHNVTALGLVFDTFSGSAFDFTLSNGDNYSDTSTPGFGTLAFLGLTDTSSFNTLTISVPGANDTVLLTDVQYGAANPVSEPSSLRLLAAACAMLVIWSYRTKPRQHAVTA